MTISTTTTTARFTGNAVTTIFPYTFRILAATDLVVTKRLATTLVESTLSYPTDYTVSGVGNATGGSITLISAPATGDLLVIERNTSRTQSTSIRNQGSYFPETHENVFDKLTMLVQEDETALGRTFSLPKTLDPANYNLELPVPVSGQVLTWNANGLTNGSVSTSSVVLPGEGRDTTTLTAYLANNYAYNVLDYDADPTGVVDSTVAINQALLNAGGNAIAAIKGAATGVGGASGGVSDAVIPSGLIGGVVILPRGKYLISGPLYIPAGCALIGYGTGSVLNHTGAANAIEFVRPSGDGYSFRAMLADFTIWGNNNGASQNGVYAEYVHSAVMQRVMVRQCGGWGFYINDHTVGLRLVDVFAVDNHVGQAFFDGLAASSYQNCDSHTVQRGVFWCNVAGVTCIRQRRTSDIKMYSPIVSGNATTVGLQLEGAKDALIDAPFVEGHSQHLNVVQDSVTSFKSQGVKVRSGSWEGGAVTSMALALNGDVGTILEDLNIHAPPASGSAQSILTVSTSSVNPTIIGNLERLGLTGAGYNNSLRIIQRKVDAVNAQSLPPAGQNLLQNACTLNGAGWTPGGGLTLTPAVTGPAPGIPATRVQATSASNNSVYQQTAGSASNGNIYGLAFWARAVSGAAWMDAKLSVPGVGDEIDEAISLGTTFRRYTVQGAVGTQVGNVAAVFTVPNGTTVEIAGVDLRLGSAGPYEHTNAAVGLAVPVGEVFLPGDVQATGGYRQTLYGWAQATTVTGTQTDVALTDTVAARGRTMPRAGSITSVAARLTSVWTAGTLTIKVQKSTDSGATWNTVAGPQVAISTAVKSAQATFAKDTYAFNAGDMLRLTITTVSFTPTANDCDAALEVES